MSKAAAKKVTALTLGFKDTFIGRGGREFNLKEPEGFATEGQVMSLYKRGHLVITAEPVEPFSKGQASWAMDELNGE